MMNWLLIFGLGEKIIAKDIWDNVHVVIFLLKFVIHATIK